MKKLYWLVLLLPLVATAKEEAKDPAFKVTVNPSVYDAAAFEKKGFNTTRMPAQVAHPSALPSKEEREEAFAQVKDLEVEIAEMDQLDRDMLFMRARLRPLEQLKKQYPQISGDLLDELQKVVRK